RHLSSAPGPGHTDCTENSAAIPAGTCGAGPSAGRRGSMRFAQADVRKNPGPSPVRQRMKNRGGEENCKVAANKLRKIQRALAERIPLNPPRAHGTRPSNASFETKHHPPAAFPGSLSFTEGRRTNVILREKSRKLLLWWQPCRLRWES